MTQVLKVVDEQYLEKSLWHRVKCEMEGFNFNVTYPRYFTIQLSKLQYLIKV